MGVLIWFTLTQSAALRPLSPSPWEVLHNIWPRVLYAASSAATCALLPLILFSSSSSSKSKSDESEEPDEPDGKTSLIIVLDILLAIMVYALAVILVDDPSLRTAACALAPLAFYLPKVLSHLSSSSSTDDDDDATHTPITHTHTPHPFSSSIRFGSLYLSYLASGMLLALNTPDGTYSDSFLAAYVVVLNAVAVVVALNLAHTPLSPDLFSQQPIGGPLSLTTLARICLSVSIIQLILAALSPRFFVHILLCVPFVFLLALVSQTNAYLASAFAAGPSRLS